MLCACERKVLQRRAENGKRVIRHITGTQQQQQQQQHSHCERMMPNAQMTKRKCLTQSWKEVIHEDDVFSLIETKEPETSILSKSCSN